MAKNRRTLFFALAFGVVIVITAIRIWVLSPEAASSLPSLGKVPPFSLLNEDSMRVTESVLHDKVTIADFIFTSCAGVCPVMSTRMSELQQTLINDPHVQFISFSVDPETDGPGVLNSYARGYGAIKGKWHFFTGPKKDIYQLTREGFHLGLDTEGDDAIIHSQKFVLVDSEGVIRGYYDSEEPAAMSQLVTDTRSLQEAR